MESSLLLSASRPLKPSLPIPCAHRHHAFSFRTRSPPLSTYRGLPCPLPRSGRWRVAPGAASEVFDDIHSQDNQPGVGRGGARRRDYREEQGEPAPPPLSAAARGVARYVVPAGALLALSFVIWKVVQNVFPQKRKDRTSGEPTSSGITWSFAAGSSLSTSVSFNSEKESRKNLNKFYKVLRTLKTVDMAGCQFGDEGLFFLAESLAYNKSVEEVDFSGNAITAVGIEAFDGILQINTALKTLNLSGNSIGDDGAKIMQSIGFLGPAFFLTLLSKVRTPAMAVLCMACSQGSDAFSQSGLYLNHQDIGPRYAGVLLGLSNTAGVLAGVFGTAATGYILQKGSWDNVFQVAMGVTKEAIPRKEFNMWDAAGVTNPVPSWPPQNIADDPKLHNPLLRRERMGCGWLGVIFEWEGVIVEDDTQLQKQVWLTLAQEEGKSPPLAFVLKRIEGMKTEHAITEVLCWSRDPSELRRLASRKEEIHCNLRGSPFFHMRDGSREFMSTLANNKIPLAVASTRPRKVIEEAIEAVGVRSFFDAVVAAEDVYRGKPDPEMFLYAAQLLSFIPERCIVFGNSNSAVEAAHDARMKCVAVASKHPIYELSAADLVVRQLNEISVVDLKNLSDIDSPEFGMEPQPEMEEEEDDAPPSTLVGVDDIFL